MIFGKENVQFAIKNNALIEKIYFTGKLNINVSNNIKFQKVTDEKMVLLTNSNQHEGICAKIHQFKYYTLSEIEQDALERIIVLDDIMNNQNLGMIIRSANAFGVKHLFILESNSAASVNFETLKIARGGLNDLKIIRIQDMSEAIRFLKNKGVTVYTTALSEAAKPLGKFSPSKKFAVILGNEATGVSESSLLLADEIVFIKMFGSVQSLNVSVAAGIVLFELTKTSD